MYCFSVDYYNVVCGSYNGVQGLILALYLGITLGGMVRIRQMPTYGSILPHRFLPSYTRKLHKLYKLSVINQNLRKYFSNKISVISQNLRKIF